MHHRMRSQPDVVFHRFIVPAMANVDDATKAELQAKSNECAATMRTLQKTSSN